jgi:hypothetical protein
LASQKVKGLGRDRTPIPTALKRVLQEWELCELAVAPQVSASVQYSAECVSDQQTAALQQVIALQQETALLQQQSDARWQQQQQDWEQQDAEREKRMADSRQRHEKFMAHIRQERADREQQQREWEQQRADRERQFRSRLEQQQREWEQQRADRERQFRSQLEQLRSLQDQVAMHTHAQQHHLQQLDSTTSQLGSLQQQAVNRVELGCVAQSSSPVAAA